MSKKLTLEFVKEYSLKDGTKCHSNEYINNSEYLQFECPSNHFYTMRWYNFKQGNRCSECYGNKKYTIEYIKKESIEKYNITCLVDEYINSQTKMPFKCKNNHIYYIHWNNVIHGYGCSTCSKNKKKTIEEIKEYALLDGTKCISKEYINSQEKLDFICSKNHTYQMISNDFQQGHRCRKCYLNNNYGENHPSYKKDRTRKRRLKNLSFDLYKHKILLDDPNYEYFLENYIKSKNKEIIINIYSVDHIFPRVAFINNDLDNIYNKRLIYNICNLRENLRIIIKKENTSKAGKYNQQDFLDWFNLKLKEQQEFL